MFRDKLTLEKLGFLILLTGISLHSTLYDQVWGRDEDKNYQLEFSRRCSEDRVDLAG